MKNKDLFILLSKYHGCWWPGSLCRLGISSHGIELVLPEHSIQSAWCLLISSMSNILHFIFWYVFLVNNQIPSTQQKYVCLFVMACIVTFYLCVLGICVGFHNKHLLPMYLWDLTHWGRVMHIWVNKLTIQIMAWWTNARILSIEPLGTNLSEILNES